MKRGTARAKSKGGSCERAIREYFGGILSGEIIACEKMKQVAAHVLRDMDNANPLYPYHYREEFAQKHVVSSKASAAYRPGAWGTISS